MRNRIQPGDGVLIPEDAPRELPSSEASVLLQECRAELRDNTRDERTTWLREFVGDLIGIDDGRTLIPEELGC